MTPMRFAMDPATTNPHVTGPPRRLRITLFLAYKPTGRVSLTSSYVPKKGGRVGKSIGRINALLHKANEYPRESPGHDNAVNPHFDAVSAAVRPSEPAEIPRCSAIFPWYSERWHDSYRATPSILRLPVLPAWLVVYHTPNPESSRLGRRHSCHPPKDCPRPSPTTWSSTGRTRCSGRPPTGRGSAAGWIPCSRRGSTGRPWYRPSIASTRNGPSTSWRATESRTPS